MRCARVRAKLWREGDVALADRVRPERAVRSAEIEPEMGANARAKSARGKTARVTPFSRGGPDLEVEASKKKKTG
jgi:hypothetical protein